MMFLFSALQILLFWWENYFFMQLAIVHSLINMQSENYQLSKIKFMSKNVHKYPLTSTILSFSPALHQHYYLLGHLYPLQYQR